MEKQFDIYYEIYINLDMGFIRNGFNCYFSYTFIELILVNSNNDGLMEFFTLNPLKQILEKLN